MSSTNFAACGNAGVIVYAPTGLSTWQVATSPTTQNLVSILANTAGGMYNIVGAGGTSVNGTGASMVLASTGTTQDLNKIIFTSQFSPTGSVVAVGNAGTYLYTSNYGSNWTAITPTNTADLISITNNSAGTTAIAIDANGFMFYKSNISVSGGQTNLNSYATYSAVTAANGIIFTFGNPLGATSTTMSYISAGSTNSAVSTTNTMATAITDVTSVGTSGSDLFVINQTTGNAKYTTNFATLTDLGVPGVSTMLLGDRVIIGTDNVLNVAQTGFLANIITAQQTSLGPTLTASLNFDRNGDTVLGFDSLGNIWKLPDITSTAPRAGLQMVVSTTEIV
jgi:hypothetical protein